MKFLDVRKIWGNILNELRTKQPQYRPIFKGDWLVKIRDNHRPWDEEILHGRFETENDAIEAAKKIIEDCITHAYRPGANAETLFNGYCGYGDEPTVSGSSFSARDYALKICRKLCNQ